MIENFFRAFQNSRGHWVFWPFVLLMVQVALYNFLFSKNGYLSYLDKSREKEKLKNQIAELQVKKSELNKKLAHMKNEDEVIKDFIRKLYRYDDKYIIVKFIDGEESPRKIKEDKMNLALIQRLYILISTIILSVFTGYSWKKHKLMESHET